MNKRKITPYSLYDTQVYLYVPGAYVHHANELKVKNAKSKFQIPKSKSIKK